MKPHEYSSSFASARCDDCGKSRDTRTYDTPDEPAVDVADIISWARRHAKRGHYVERR